MPRHNSTALRFEAWTLPWDSGGFKRVIASIPVVEGTGRGSLHFRSVAGDGAMDIDVGSFDRLDDIISDTVGRLIRVFDGATIIHEWIAERVTRVHEDNQRIAQVSGPSLQAAFDRWILYPYDYPADPSNFPDWEWGSDGKTNLLKNNEFDSSGESEKQQYHVHGSSGTYTITVPSFGTTVGIAPYENGGRASDVKAALEGIAGINEVATSGRGHTQYDPMIIEFKDPLLDYAQITIDDSSLVNSGCAHPPCHSPLIKTLRNGSFSIEPWTRCEDPLTGSLVPVLHGKYNSITVVDDPALGAPTKAIRIDPAQSNAGIQQIVPGKQGAPVFGSFDVYTSSTTDEFFITILDKSEKIIGRQGPFTVASANTWETFEMTTVNVDGVLLDDDLVFRVQCSAGHSIPSVFHLKNMTLFEGQAAANVGEIVNALMDDATTDHASDPRGTVLTWVDYSTITDTLDSSGAAWSSDISFNAPFGSTYGHAWDGLASLGYEWELVPKSTPSGGLTHDLRWYNKGNRDDAPSGAAITVKAGVTGGNVVKRIPNYSAVVLEGSDGAFHEDTDATAITNFGRFETFQAARQTPDAATLTLLGDEILNQEATNRTAVQFSVVATPDHARPLVDYIPGDTVPMQMPPTMSKESRRVQRVDYANSYPTSYVVVGSRVLLGEAGGWELVRRMWRAFERRDQDTVSGGGGVGGKGVRTPWLIVAASNAADWMKEGADYVCDGVDDHEEVQAAVEEIEAAGGEGGVLMTGGEFAFSWPATGAALVESNVTGITIEGMGNDATVIKVTGSNGVGETVIDLGGSGSAVRNLRIEDNSAGTFPTNGIVLGANYCEAVNVAGWTNNHTNSVFLSLLGVECRAEFVNVDFGGVGIEVSGSYSSVVSCQVLGVSDTGIRVISTGAFVRLIGNVIGTSDLGIDMGSGATDILISQNYMETSGKAVTGTNADDIKIIGNDFVISGGGNAIEGNGERWHIIGNKIGAGVASSVGWYVNITSGGNYEWMISDNICFDGSGIQFTTEQHLVISGNILQDGQIIGTTALGVLIEGNEITNGTIDTFDAIIGFNGNASDCSIINNVIYVPGGFNGIRIVGTGTATRNIISGNKIGDAADLGIALVGATECLIQNNQTVWSGEHGIYLEDCVDCLVQDNFVKEAGQNLNNTWDGIHVTGTSTGNYIEGNKVTGDGPFVDSRYGINIADANSQDNVVVGNDLRDIFATNNLNDAGTNTVLSYPSNAIYGDNFTGVNQIPTVTAATETEASQTITPTQP